MSSKQRKESPSSSKILSDSSVHTTPKSESSSSNDATTQKYALSFDNVIKGPLKLKGRGGITKKHKTNNNNQKAILVEKTEAEEKYDTKSMERKKKLIKERAQKSYREKINEFNDRIAKISEYNDLPKV